MQGTGNAAVSRPGRNQIICELSAYLPHLGRRSCAFQVSYIQHYRKAGVWPQTGGPKPLQRHNGGTADRHRGTGHAKLVFASQWKFATSMKERDSIRSSRLRPIRPKHLKRREPSLRSSSVSLTARRPRTIGQSLNMSMSIGTAVAGA